MVQVLEDGGISMSTLESQYKLFLEQNPDKAHWSYIMWLKWHGDNFRLAESIGEIDPVVSDDFQIGPNGAYEYTEGKQYKTKDMARIIIQFAEDEMEDARTAIDGHKYKMLIWELDQKLRSVSKYGAALKGNGEATVEEMGVCSDIRDLIREMLQEDNLTIE